MARASPKAQSKPSPRLKTSRRLSSNAFFSLGSTRNSSGVEVSALTTRSKPALLTAVLTAAWLYGGWNSAVDSLNRLMFSSFSAAFTSLNACSYWESAAF